MPGRGRLLSGAALPCLATRRTRHASLQLRQQQDPARRNEGGDEASDSQEPRQARGDQAHRRPQGGNSETAGSSEAADEGAGSTEGAREAGGGGEAASEATGGSEAAGEAAGGSEAAGEAAARGNEAAGEAAATAGSV